MGQRSGRIAKRRGQAHRVVKPARPLREEPFFSDMSSRVLAAIENSVYHREYEPRQIIYFPDDPCDNAYWVRKGRVKISRLSGDGREVTFRHVHAGEFFGEECLVRLARRGAYAEALEPSVLCVIGAADLRRIVREEGELSGALAQYLGRRLVEMENVFAETVFRSVRSRVASGLLRLYRHSGAGREGTLHITHQELASLIGSTRETTTVVLHGLCKPGIIRIGNRRVTVVDPARLEHVARSG